MKGERYTVEQKIRILREADHGDQTIEPPRVGVEVTGSQVVVKDYVRMPEYCHPRDFGVHWRRAVEQLPDRPDDKKWSQLSEPVE